MRNETSVEIEGFFVFRRFSVSRLVFEKKTTSENENQTSESQRRHRTVRKKSIYI